LLDTYCLGVKDAYWRIESPVEYHELTADVHERTPIRKASAECVAKLVNGAVEYARSLGLPPHRDFRHAERLLAGINPSACTEEFTFGRNGKPLYIQGPHDSPARIAQIMTTLSENSPAVEGSDNRFDFVVKKDLAAQDHEYYEAFAEGASSGPGELVDEDELSDIDLLDMGGDDAK
jgi:hypothetical protein